MGHWSKLPVDLLKVIEGHLMLYVDKVRIRVVCVTWNSGLPKMPNNQVKQLPWLLHPLDNNIEATHGLLNPIDKKVYEIYLPEARGKLFKGSSYGWIVTVEDMHSSSPTNMYLINPLTRARIKLPPRSKFADVVQYRANQVDEEYIVRMYYDVLDYEPDSEEEEFIDEFISSSYMVNLDLTMKVVLSSAPCDECVLVAIYGHGLQLAWCRCNDEKWTHIYARASNFKDIIFHKGKLHALTDVGKLFVFENIGTNLDTKVTKIAATGVLVPRKRCPHLAVCSDGGLLMVWRHFDDKRHFDVNGQEKYWVRTIGFKLYKLDSLNLSWVEVKNIGDDILFLGFNSCWSISSHDLVGPGYKRNHIYFSDSTSLGSVGDNETSDSDVGVYNLEDGTLESFPGLSQPMWPRPIWVHIG